MMTCKERLGAKRAEAILNDGLGRLLRQAALPKSPAKMNA
jgi:hypothetical protein